MIRILVSSLQPREVRVDKGTLRPVFTFMTAATLLVASGCDGASSAGDSDTATDPGPPSCDEGYRHEPDLPDAFLDDFPDRCVPQSCGSGRWGDLEVDEDTVFVDATMSEVGDGSENAPFTSIQAGLDAASAGGDGRVVVAAGVYFESILLTETHHALHLAGRCQELVVVDTSEGQEDVTGFRAEGLDGTESWRVEGLTITNAPGGGIWLEGGELTASNLLLTGNRKYGAFSQYDTSRLILDRVSIADTLPTSDGVNGRGIYASGGAWVKATSCVLQGNTEAGVLASGTGTQVTLADLKIQDTQAVADGDRGFGIAVQNGAHLDATSCVLERNSAAGVFAGLEGTTVTLEGIEIRDTRPRSNGLGGMGIYALDGARLKATSCVLVGNTKVGVLADKPGSEIVLLGVEVHDTLPSDDGKFGRGINVQGGSRLDATSCVVDGNSGAGIFASGEGTEVALSDVEVRGTKALAGGGGRGVSVQGGARFDMTSCTVTGNTEIGVIAEGAGTELSLLDVEIRETRRDAVMTVAVGLVSQSEATVNGTDVVVTQTQGPGVFVPLGSLSCDACTLTNNAFAGALVWWGGYLELWDTVISGTISDANEGGGFGIYTYHRNSPNTVFVEGTTISDHAYAAVWLDGDGTYLFRNNTLVGGHGIDLEYPDGTADHRYGDALVATAGVTAWDGAHGLLLDSNEIRDAARSGVLLDASSAFLTNNTFAGNATDLILQDCDGVEEPTGMDDGLVVDHCPFYSHHMASLDFDLHLDDGEPL